MIVTDVAPRIIGLTCVETYPLLIWMSKWLLAQECPTLWRIYQYVTDEERNLIKKSREEKKQFSTGRGGEGFIGTDEWCYNCANTGHLGDVSGLSAC